MSYHLEKQTYHLGSHYTSLGQFGLGTCRCVVCCCCVLSWSVEFGCCCVELVLARFQPGPRLLQKRVAHLSQLSQDAWPIFEAVPASQLKQVPEDFAPRVAEEVPASHDVQALEPSEVE